MSLSELRVANASNVVDLLGREVPREQWRRELLENARLAGANRVVFDAWRDPESGHELIRVADDGCGMNPRVLERRIRELADPTRLETFGIGGRISTAVVSPAGVAWASREKGAPAAMVVMRHERGRWGLEQFPDEDGRSALTAEPLPGMLPPLSREQGTSVILYGDGRHSTWRRADAVRIATYLARRYWTFGTTEVQARAWRQGGDPARPTTRIPSTSELVERYEEQNGVVSLEDGSSIRWYLVGESNPGGITAGGYRSILATGLAVQHGDELYDRADRVRFARFGIYTRSAQARVVLVVEPAESLEIEPNAQRTRLVQPGGRDLPWQDWARSFVEHLPPELAALLPTSMPLDLEQLAAQFGPEWRDRIKARPKPLRAAAGPEEGFESALELAATLDPIVRDTSEHDEEQPATSDEEPVRQEPVETSPPKRKAVNVQADGRTPARAGRRHSVPEPKPIEPEDWPYGDNYDFAYGEATNELYYKTTGEAIERQTRYWVERCVDVDAHLIATTVRNAYAIEMVGKILHVLDVYAGREDWTDPLEELVSPRALTFASLGFHAVDAMIDERLRRELPANVIGEDEPSVAHVTSA